MKLINSKTENVYSSQNQTIGRLQQKDKKDHCYEQSTRQDNVKLYLMKTPNEYYMWFYKLLEYFEWVEIGHVFVLGSVKDERCF